MDQTKPKTVAQVFYNNRWVDKEHFRAFVYKDSEQKLAKSYKEFEDLIATGVWFDSAEKAKASKKIKLEELTSENFPQPAIPGVIELKKVKARKPKHGANS